MSGPYASALKSPKNTALPSVPPPFDPAAIETFAGEGTRELYVGDASRPGRLLLMQPIADGPYQRSLDDRGEGLHHVAWQVPDLRAELARLSGTGWLLHPRSAADFADHQQVWLCRPGVHALFELVQGDARYEGDPVVHAVRMRARPDVAPLVPRLEVGALHAHDAPATLTFDGGRQAAI